MSDQVSNLHVPRHWLATRQGAGYVAVARTVEDADDYRAQGWTVRGPFVPEAQQPEGAVEEVDRLRRLVCTCRAYDLNFSAEGPPPHRESCPAIPPVGGQ